MRKIVLMLIDSPNAILKRIDCTCLTNETDNENATFR